MKELKETKRAFVQTDNLDDISPKPEESEAKVEGIEEPKKRGKKKK